MTSGSFALIDISRISIRREERQRRALPDLTELKDSISRNGLIHPIVVTEELELVAGECRLESCRQLGWTQIQVQYLSSLDENTKQEVELEENIKRAELSWEDRCRAIFNYHNLRKSTASDWTHEDTATALGISTSNVDRNIMVAKELTSGNAMVKSAPRFSTAAGIVARANERKAEAAISSVHATLGTKPATLAVPDTSNIIHSDFADWWPTYEGPKFNLIHCDFPYGIHADKHAQGAAVSHGGYDDSPEHYWRLCEQLVAALPRIAADSCHFVFWFSMHFYHETREFFHSKSDITFDPFPFIWLKSDNVGIIPDPVRGGRRIYETALFGSRGDRKIVRPVSNAYYGPTIRERHMSEKPQDMLGHFFRMLVDGSSLVLDPTAGSASAVRAAEAAGARLAVGVERDKEFVERAREALAKQRREKDAKVQTPSAAE